MQSRRYTSQLKPNITDYYHLVGYQYQVHLNKIPTEYVFKYILNKFT